MFIIDAVTWQGLFSALKNQGVKTLFWISAEKIVGQESCTGT